MSGGLGRRVNRTRVIISACEVLGLGKPAAEDVSDLSLDAPCVRAEYQALIEHDEPWSVFSLFKFLPENSS